ncbi:uncharacterized protein V1518DRAFT_416331 [Limtongia smithiae]|uniref:uncharacterized protein n=1 Tax=Limtongia smithiae TaxID=1125753 RepID=UPI0034CF75F5
MMNLPPPSQMMTDPNMNVLWSSLVELSSTLNANREATARLFRLAESVGNTSTAALAAAATTNAGAVVDGLKRRVAGLQGIEEGVRCADLRAYRLMTDDCVQGDGGLQIDSELPLSQSLSKLDESASALVNDNEMLRRQLDMYRRERDDLDVLTQQYDHTLSRIMGALREYTTSQADSVIGIHKAYDNKLDEERTRYQALYDLYSEQEQRIKGLAESLNQAYRYSCAGSGDYSPDLVPTSTPAAANAAAVPPAHHSSSGEMTEVEMLYQTIYALETENRGLKRILGIDKQ